MACRGLMPEGIGPVTDGNFETDRYTSPEALCDNRLLTATGFQRTWLGAASYSSGGT